MFDEGAASRTLDEASQTRWRGELSHSTGRDSAVRAWSLCIRRRLARGTHHVGAFMNAVLFAIVFAYVGASDVTAFSQVSGVQQSEKTLILRFEYGDTVEELHWDLAEFTFDPGTSVYLLEVESLDLELVQGLSFQCRYQFSIPAEMGFEYEFTVGDLLPPIMPGSHIDAVRPVLARSRQVQRLHVATRGAKP